MLNENNESYSRKNDELLNSFFVDYNEEYRDISSIGEDLSSESRYLNMNDFSSLNFSKYFESVYESISNSLQYNKHSFFNDNSDLDIIIQNCDSIKCSEISSFKVDDEEKELFENDVDINFGDISCIPHTFLNEISISGKKNNNSDISEQKKIEKNEENRLIKINSYIAQNRKDSSFERVKSNNPSKFFESKYGLNTKVYNNMVKGIENLSENDNEYVLFEKNIEYYNENLQFSIKLNSKSDFNSNPKIEIDNESFNLDKEDLKDNSFLSFSDNEEKDIIYQEIQLLNKLLNNYINKKKIKKYAVYTQKLNKKGKEKNINDLINKNLNNKKMYILASNKKVKNNVFRRILNFLYYYIYIINKKWPKNNKIRKILKLYFFFKGKRKKINFKIIEIINHLKVLDIYATKVYIISDIFKNLNARIFKVIYTDYYKNKDIEHLKLKYYSQKNVLISKAKIIFILLRYLLIFDKKKEKLKRKKLIS